MFVLILLFSPTAQTTIKPADRKRLKTTTGFGLIFFFLILCPFHYQNTYLILKYIYISNKFIYLSRKEYKKPSVGSSNRGLAAG